MNKSVQKDTLVAYIKLIGIVSVFGLTLSIVRLFIADNYGLTFLPWNLALAWIPLIFAYLLYKRTAKHGLIWSKTNFAFFVLWLVFLPNAFYLMTDFIHLRTAYGVRPMFDVVILMTYSIAGLALGYMSLLLVHLRALQRFGHKGHYFAVGALLASGFAIYIGRYLRWNSWDIILNPFGILIHITDRVLHPFEHILTFGTTILYFAFLSIIYWVIWRIYTIATSK